MSKLSFECCKCFHAVCACDLLVHMNAACELVFCRQSRIKKMMQKDAEVGRIAMAVPVIICILHTSLRCAGNDASSFISRWGMENN